MNFVEQQSKEILYLHTAYQEQSEGRYFVEFLLFNENTDNSSYINSHIGEIIRNARKLDMRDARFMADIMKNNNVLDDYNTFKYDNKVKSMFPISYSRYTGKK